MKFDSYEPIKTLADRRADRIERFKQGVKYIFGIKSTVGDHIKHRLDWRIVGKEVVNHVTDKVIPHGCDEIGNVLFSGSAYLPWPGNAGPEPIDYEQAKAEAARLEQNHDQGHSR